MLKQMLAVCYEVIGDGGARDVMFKKGSMYL